MANYQTPVKVESKKHSPFSHEDRVSPEYIPISERPNNLIEVASDGLYLGITPNLPEVYVDASVGNDSNPGTAARPLRTIDKAMELIAEETLFLESEIVVALKCGQDHELTKRHYLTNKARLVITYYGDTNYGSYNTDPYARYLRDLNRPIIKPLPFEEGGLQRLAGFDSSVAHWGVHIELPPHTGDYLPEAAYGVVDYIVPNVNRLNDIDVDLQGVVVNKPDFQGEYGFLGILSRTKVVLNTYASQFLLSGQKANATSNLGIRELAKREDFVKFYNDKLPGSDRIFLYESTQNSSNGSGLLELYWVDVPVSSIPAGPTIETFPYLLDSSYGLRYYFHNMKTTPNGQPLSVLSPRNF